MPTAIGKCFCGAVSVSVKYDPNKVIMSHSNEDRLLSGAPFYVWLETFKQNVEISGDFHVFHFHSEKSRAFCKKCYTLLTFENDGIIRAPVGLFNHAFKMKPRQVEALHQKLPWIDDHEKTVEKLDFFLTHPTMRIGNSGERYIATKTQAFLTGHKAGYDLEVKSGQKIEVKTSSLNRSNPNSPSTRWAWARVGSKENYDWLVLLGEIDERYRKEYDFPENKFVCFLVPYAYVKSLCNNNDIQLNSNPRIEDLKPL